MEVCGLTPSMTFAGCNIGPILDYNGSVVDIWINYTTLILTLVSVVICTRKANEHSFEYRRAAPWFWVPFSVVLVLAQIFADCSSNNVGISAIWSAYTGFIVVGSWRLQGLWKAGGRESMLATIASVSVWMGVCAYYAFTEPFITTLAHLVAFAVGAISLGVFEVLHMRPRYQQV
ncbi:unnamed protein product [Choristocarpus tenellus]